MTININSESTDEEEDAALSNNDVEEQWCSPMEDEQMSKAQTVYIYKKREILQEAVDNKDPIAGIIIKGINQSAELYALFKHPGKKFGWMRICFDDAWQNSMVWSLVCSIYFENSNDLATKELRVNTKYSKDVCYGNSTLVCPW
jgi:hypothetical protein